MNNLAHTAEVITISEIAKYLNNDGLNQEIIAFDHEISFSNDDKFPQRIDALVIVLCNDGIGKIGIDLREYELKRNSLLVVQPKNYIYQSNNSGNLKCSVAICSKHLTVDVLPRLTDILPLLIHHRTEPVTQLQEDEAAGIRTFYDFLRLKLNGPRTHFLKQKIRCMLQATLYEMMDINYNRNAGKTENPRTRKEEIMAKFIIAVGEEFRTVRQVSHYAEKLCISPKHLSSVVKEISGRTAGDWIENYVVMESKVLLKTTDMTIQEIAVYLNFANQSFFGKYFKQHTGYSPTSYRKQFS